MAKKLPKQVQAQIAESERLAQELELQNSGADTTEELHADESQSPETQQHSAQDQSFTAEQNEVQTLEAEGQEDVGATEGGQASEDYSKEEVEDPNSETFQKRWETLQGLYNSEKKTTSELVGRVTGLENMLAQLSSVRDQELEDEPNGNVQTNLVSDEEIDEYGSDLIDVMKRAARDAVKDEFDALAAENNKLKSMIGGVGQKVEQDDREKVYAELASKVDNWQTLNRSPAFLRWLDEIDVYAGEPRKSLLGRAFAANDATRVISFFKGFIDEHAAVSRAADDTSTEVAPAPSKTSLESLVSPGAGASGTADKTSDQGRMWKESEIGSFYESARKGKFKGRDDVYVATEKQIQAALSEGRILLGQ